MAECVACFRECPPGLRWCSNACFYAEDGYPDDSYEEDDESED